MRRAAVLLLLTAMTLGLTWPIWIDPANTRMGAGSDPSLYIWNIAWNTHALTHAPWAILDANIFFPHTYTLAYSEHLIGSSLLALPFAWIGGPQAATNLVSVLAVLLCAIGGWFLGRSYGLSPGAAAMCGLIFAFAPPRFARVGQLHLNAIQWMPFAMAFFHRYQDTGRAADLRWAMAAFSAQALTSGHGTVLLLLGLTIQGLSRLAHGWPLALATRVRDVGLIGLLALVPAALSYLPYWLASLHEPFQRVTDPVGPSVVSYISSPTYVHQWLLRQLPDWTWVRQEPDAFLFPGLLALTLAAIAATTNFRRLWPWVLMVVLTWWATLGPPLSIWQWVQSAPLLRFIRVPSRFTMLGVLALALLAGVGFDWLTRRWSERRRLAAALVCLAVLCAEYTTFVDSRPFAPNTTAVDRWLNTQPKPFAIAEVPVSASTEPTRRAEVATMYMLHTLAHYQPTVFGYSGTEPRDYPEVYDALIAFPSTESVDFLAARGVTYVVAHLEYLSDEGRPAYVARLAAMTDRLQLVYEAELGQVYRILR